MQVIFCAVRKIETPLAQHNTCKVSEDEKWPICYLSLVWAAPRQLSAKII